jgi:hypothetical protein
MKKRLARVLLAIAAPLALIVSPAIAQAQTYNFVNLDGYFPASQVFGPANHYPGRITVSGLAGTVTKVTVTAISLGASPELDMALVGPNGQAVMLLSDACSAEKSFLGGNGTADWTFDDAAPTVVPSACGENSTPTTSHFQLTNFGNPEEDVFPGGPQGPFLNKLAFLAGGSPNGNWDLFMVDDTEAVLGFLLHGWVLTLEVEPPPPPAPTIVQVPVQVPGPAQTNSVAPTSKETGDRAAAMKKCPMKKTKAKRKGCRAKAQKLPV